MKSPPPLSRPPTHRAFTLIELLTVVGIIMLLAALILQAIGRAREKGRQVSCASNLRQIGQSIAMFASDNNRSVPYATTNVLAAAGIFDRSNRSFGLLSNYLSRSTSVFRCPSDTRRLSAVVTNFTSFLVISNACSYSHARTMSWGIGFENAIVSLDRVGTGTNNFNLLSPTNGVAGATWATSNHKRAGNILFGDGRVATHPALPSAINNGPIELNAFFDPSLGWLYTNIIRVTVQNPL